MRPERYDRVAAIFLDVCDLATAERGRVLDDRCSGDGSLRSEVLRLLECDPVGDRFLPPPSAIDVGERIGPYRLLKELGSGGMGSVYLAEQEGPIRRRVAVKVIRAGMATREVVTRFEGERQALARLDHPGIAKVHEAGTTEEGLPYFVMELVEGESITGFCDGLHLGMRERLELFVGVCEAVEHAHGRGIIHRDLKPSNVLGYLQDGKKPSGKVIDFGVAKAVDGPGWETTLTGSGRPIGTIAYMSPEQAGGEGVDRRSDVYALGTLLHEILVGEPPIEARSSRLSLEEMLRRVREEEPPAASVAWSRLSEERRGELSRRRGCGAGELGSELRGDLDWIIQKATAKERRRRYGSAGELAADIRRHLGDEAVEARPPGAWYRARKYARRNRWPVTAAAGIVAALAVGLAMSMVEESRTRAALGVAEERRAEVMRLSDVKELGDLRSEWERLPTTWPGKREAMGGWVRRARSLAGRREEHRRTLAAQDPKAEGLAERWERDLLAEIVRGLEALEDPSGGKGSIARVERWMEETPGEEEIEKRWREAIGSIGDAGRCPKYGGLGIVRQSRLIPLGRDEGSGLWEFSDPGTGLPPRGRSGRWEIAEETGVVLVLLPGGSFDMGSPLGEEWRVRLDYDEGWPPGKALLLERTLEIGLAAVRSFLERSSILSRPQVDDVCRRLARRLFRGPEDEPLHRVAISPFFLSKYEVTRSIWKSIVGFDPSMEGGPGTPVHFISWMDCRIFCSGSGLVMPTEAQWEYACRAGKGGPFGGTGRLTDMAWITAGDRAMYAVGRWRANGFGLHDMHGNAWEWCRDDYDSDFYRAPAAGGLDPECRVPSIPSAKVLRGGNWTEPAWRLRSAARHKDPHGYRNPTYGFRPSRPLER